jgi:hypothetical protein
MSIPATKSNLVVVRAGDKSLHRQWLSGGAPRNWDLVVSYYGSDTDIFRDDDSWRIDHRGGKWDGLYKLFTEHPRLLDYERIWLPDDDISTTTEAVNRIFDAMVDYGVDLMQPSLTPDSYVSWYHTLANRKYRFRYSNLVEIMVPCLTSAHLKTVLPLMRASMSGVGLDYVWCRLFPNPMWRAGILDEVSVRHTRPIGSALAVEMRGVDRSAEDELENIRRMVPGLSRRPQKEMHPYGAIDRSGRKVTGKLRLSLGVLQGLSDADLSLSPMGARVIKQKKWKSAKALLRHGAALDPLELRPV